MKCEEEVNEIEGINADGNVGDNIDDEEIDEEHEHIIDNIGQEEENQSEQSIRRNNSISNDNNEEDVDMHDDDDCDDDDDDSDNFRSGIFRTTDECHIIQRGAIWRNKSIDTIYKLIERFPMGDVKYYENNDLSNNNYPKQPASRILYEQSISQNSISNNNNEEDVDIDDDDDDGDDDVIFDSDDDNDDSRSGISRTDECHIQRYIRKNKSIDTIYKLIEQFSMGDVNYENDLRDLPKHTLSIYRCNFPVHTACTYGHNVLAMNLVDIFPKAVKRKNEEGLYPLQLAMRRMYRQSEDLMMKLIEIFPEAVIQSTEDADGTTTALLFACKRNKSIIFIEKLIEIHPFAIQEDNQSGEYPIHGAIRYNQSIAVIKFLLDNDPLWMQRKEHYLKSPFHVACEKNNVDLIKYFIEEHSADLQINDKDSYGYTSLHYACTDNVNEEIVEMILHHPDINVNVTNDLFDTPLHSTLKSFLDNPSRSVIIVQKLLNHPCIMINQENRDLNTPLDIINRHIINLEKIINDQHLILSVRTLREAEERNDQHLLSLRTLQEARTLQKAEEQLRYSIEIVNILQEFPIKRRWNAYCYHINNFI